MEFVVCVAFFDAFSPATIRPFVVCTLEVINDLVID